MKISWQVCGSVYSGSGDPVLSLMMGIYRGMLVAFHEMKRRPTIVGRRGGAEGVARPSNIGRLPARPGCCKKQRGLIKNCCLHSATSVTAHLNPDVANEL